MNTLTIKNITYHHDSIAGFCPELNLNVLVVSNAGTKAMVESVKSLSSTDVTDLKNPQEYEDTSSMVIQKDLGVVYEPLAYSTSAPNRAQEIIEDLRTIVALIKTTFPSLTVKGIIFNARKAVRLFKQIIEILKDDEK